MAMLLQHIKPFSHLIEHPNIHTNTVALYTNNLKQHIFLEKKSTIY